MNNPISAQNSIIAVWLVSGNTIALALKKKLCILKRIFTCAAAHFLSVGLNNVLMKHIFFVRRHLSVADGE